MTHRPKSSVLVVASHPDDEVLGCGATMARLAERGHDIHILILGEGITSRQNTRNTEAAADELTRLHSDARKAGDALGAATVEVLGFPDNRFDSVDLLDIVKAVEAKKLAVHPEIVYTHHGGDLNIDHRRTFDAVMAACRPVVGESVRTILSFEVPSSTEWQAPAAASVFLPNEYVVLEERHLEAKIAGMEAYRSEARSYPHPRSPEALRILAQWRGVNVGAQLAEAFSVVRRIR